MTKYEFYLTNKVVYAWNSAPSYVVSANSLNCFKADLLNTGLSQDIVYNFRAEIQETRSRS